MRPYAIMVKNGVFEDGNMTIPVALYEENSHQKCSLRSLYFMGREPALYIEYLPLQGVFPHAKQ